jgi:transcriptional regulator with XRE-family HTH domain
MMLRVGISRQQYQRLESRGNPGLDTLELIAKGLNSELMLIPKEKLSEVRSVLERDISELSTRSTKRPQDKENRSLSDDPWQDLLGDDQ